MRKLFLLFFACSLFAGCVNSKKDTGDKDDDKEDKTEKTKKSDTEDETTSESSKGNWSDEDKDLYKADYAKTFKNMKENLQNDQDFDAADFDKESKKVSNCTLKILEAKYESYSVYKKSSKKPEFQQDADLMNEMADCQQNFMDKYNRN